MRFILLITLIASATCSAARIDVDPREAAVRAALQDQMDSSATRGTSVSLINGDLVTKINVGDASSELSLFEIGSISKSFAGIAISELSVEQKLDLELPISNYIPELANSFIGTVSAHLLAIHTARLPDSFIGSDGHNTEQYTETEFITFLKNYVPDPILFPAGKRQYSNLGFSTLALLIHRIEKEAYTDWVREHILLPLGMKSTGFITSKEAPAGLLQGYSVVLEPLTYSAEGELHTASGGIFSNLHDMTIYLMANINPGNELLGQAMSLSQKLGMGWDSKPGALPIEKNGGMTAGFSSVIEFDPTKKTGAVVLANDFDVLTTMHLGGIASGTPYDTLSDLPLPTETLKSLTGIYSSADGKQQIKLFSIGNNRLGFERGDGFSSPFEVFYRWRLIQQNPNVFFTNDGGSIDDVVKLKTDPVSNQIKVVYSHYRGTDSSGKPIYETNTYSRI